MKIKKATKKRSLKLLSQDNVSEQMLYAGNLRRANGRHEKMNMLEAC